MPVVPTEGVMVGVRVMVEYMTVGTQVEMAITETLGAELEVMTGATLDEVMTGATLEDMAIGVDELRAGQSVTVAAHEVMVTSSVMYTVDSALMLGRAAARPAKRAVATTEKRILKVDECEGGLILNKKEEVKTQSQGLSAKTARERK